MPSRSATVLAVPIALVGALFAGTALPQLSGSSSESRPPAVVPVSASTPEPATASPTDPPNSMPALALLADYFGEDLSAPRLRRIVREAAAGARDGKESQEQGELLRAFFCLDMRGKSDRLAAIAAGLAGDDPDLRSVLPPDCTLPSSAAGDSGRRELERFVHTYLSDDADRDTAVVTRPIMQTADAAAVDEPRLRARDFDHLDRSPLQWAVIAAAAKRQATALTFLIATVPDPVDSYESWQFDPYVDAIRQGIEGSGYLLDRFYLPDRRAVARASDGGRAEHEDRPGVILFRSNGQGPRSLLVLFLVPETPVSGIHLHAFAEALDFTTGWMSRHDGWGTPIRILGPTFSGATPSLVRGLRNAEPQVRRRLGLNVPISIVSGSASNESNRTQLERASTTTLTITFRATMHGNAAVAYGADCFLDEAGIVGVRASLSESSTGYGADLAKALGDTSKDGRCRTATTPDVPVKYPFNIAQLRADSSRDAPARVDPLTNLLPGLRPLALDDIAAPTDRIPLQAPRTTASAVDLVLSNLIAAIRRQGIRVVNIDATDVRDKLFLIRALREQAPDVVLVSTDTDLFQIHPDQAPWLRGLIVSSTYPLHPRTQRLVYPYQRQVARPNADLVQFPTVNAQGLYNAALALLNYDIDGEPQKSGDALPRLIDYGGIAGACAPTGREGIGPAVWVSVVGIGELVPMRMYCDPQQKDRDYVFRPRLNIGSAGASVHRVDISSATIMWLIALILAGAAIGRRALWPAAPRQARQRAWAVAACGPAIPLAIGGIVLLRIAWEQFSDATIAAATAAAFGPAMLGIGACGAVSIAVVAQWRFPSVLGGLSLAAAAAAAVDAGIQAAASTPQLFLQRVVDIAAHVSPLLPATALGVIPIVLAVADLRRLSAVGERSFAGTVPRASGAVAVAVTPAAATALHQPDGAPVAPAAAAPTALPPWTCCLRAVAPYALGGLTGIEETLALSHERAFGLPRSWHVATALVTVSSVLLVFGASFPPVLSVEGQLFGWLMAAAVLLLQWIFVVSVAQFLRLARAIARFTARLASHPSRLPYRQVPRVLATIGVLPRGPRLGDVSGLGEAVLRTTFPADVRAMLDQDLADPRSPRWFEGATWRLLEAELRATADAAEDGFERVRRLRARFEATSVTLVIRELLSRLSISLLLIGPAVMALVMLYVSTYFAPSHALLALLWVDAGVAIAAAIGVFFWIERDDVISRIRQTTPGRIDVNWELMSKVLVYVVVPLLLLFATQFPNIGAGLLRVFTPVQHLP